MRGAEREKLSRQVPMDKPSVPTHMAITTAQDNMPFGDSPPQLSSGVTTPNSEEWAYSKADRAPEEGCDSGMYAFMKRIELNPTFLHASGSRQTQTEWEEPPNI